VAVTAGDPEVSSRFVKVPTSRYQVNELVRSASQGSNSYRLVCMLPGMSARSGPHEGADHEVRTSVSAGVGRVVFDRSALGNAFTDGLLRDLLDALEGAAARDDVTVVRLEAAGRHFCAGWDTATFGDLARETEEAVAARLRENDDRLARLRDLPVPVVAAVRGRVAGFGAGLLAAVHLPVAASDATLAMPEVAHGICPGGVLHTLLGRLPRPAVELLVLTGHPAPAGDLLRWGLVAEVVAPDDLDARTDALAAAVAAQPAAVVRAARAATTAVLATGSPDPAYAAAAASVTRLSGARAAAGSGS
jgi:methylglutaconyl-CoA hydratase